MEEVVVPNPREVYAQYYRNGLRIEFEISPPNLSNEERKRWLENHILEHLAAASKAREEGIPLEVARHMALVAFHQTLLVETSVGSE